jgi:hypothetical protein
MPKWGQKLSQFNMGSQLGLGLKPAAERIFYWRQQEKLSQQYRLDHPDF